MHKLFYMVRKTRKLNLMGRRRFLNTLAGMGLSAGAVNHMNKDQLERLTGDPTDEVPRLAYLEWPEGFDPDAPEFSGPLPDREPVYYTISRDRWTVIESAFDAAKRLNNKIEDLDDSGLINTSVQIADNGKADEYTVNVDRVIKARKSPESGPGTLSMSSVESDPNTETPDVSLDELMGELPERAYGQAGDDEFSTAARDDIEINFTESVEWEEDEPCDSDADSRSFYTDVYRYGSNSRLIATGCHIRVGLFGRHGNPTLGPRVSPESGGSSGFLTSAHATFDQDDENPIAGQGRKVHQGGAGAYLDRIGEVAKLRDHRDPREPGHRSELDAAFIEITQADLIAGSRLASETNDTTNGRLSGIRIGRDRIKDKDYGGDIDGGTVYKQGHRTGRCSHMVRTYAANDDPDDADRIEVWRNNTEGGGNSGSPVWLEDGSRKLVAGMHRAGRMRSRCDDSGNFCFQHPVGIFNFIGDIEHYLDVRVV